MPTAISDSINGAMLRALQSIDIMLMLEAIRAIADSGQWEEVGS